MKRETIKSFAQGVEEYRRTAKHREEHHKMAHMEHIFQEALDVIDDPDRCEHYQYLIQYYGHA